MKRNLALLVLLSAGAVHPQGPPTYDADNMKQAKVDEMFAQWNRTDSPGCSVAVMRKGHIVYKKGYGMADLDHGIAIRPSTVFHVASVSKHFTNFAILLLVREGKISLDDEVRKYIPEMPDFGHRITIRHLVHHTSGLRDQWELLGLAGWRYSLDLITDRDVLAVLSRQKDLNFSPGAQYLYCNTGYTLMAQIVARVSGQSFDKFTRRRIFEPLGMNSTHFRDDHAEVIPHQAYGYNPSKNGFRLSITNFDTVGPTSLLTTAEDLARWDRNFYEMRVGDAEVHRQLLERGKLNDGETLDYAFGLVHGNYRGLPLVEHSGGDAGYRAHFLRFPEQEFSVALLCNAGSTIRSPELARRVSDIYLEDHMSGKPAAGANGPPVQLTQAELSAYAGLYWNKERDAFRRIAPKDGSLFLVFPDEQMEMEPLEKHRFRVKGFPGEILFEQTSGGPASLLEQFPGSKPNVYEAVESIDSGKVKLNDYAGDYQGVEIEPVYRVRVRDNKLFIERFKHDPSEIRPVQPDVFLSSVGTLRFARNDRGQISGFVINGSRVRNFRVRRLDQP